MYYNLHRLSRLFKDQVSYPLLSFMRAGMISVHVIFYRLIYNNIVIIFIILNLTKMFAFTTFQFECVGLS